MIFRQAKSTEAQAIAQLHTLSWQVAYRGILTDSFLDNEVLNNRLKVWEERFAAPKDNEYICVATDNNELKGFVCVYGDHDAEWGALIDNLHVLPELKRQGIGEQLMIKAAQWLKEHYPSSGLYLWVYEDNRLARQFYDKMNGKIVESTPHDNPDGTVSTILRYAWTGKDGDYFTT